MHCDCLQFTGRPTIHNSTQIFFNHVSHTVSPVKIHHHRASFALPAQKGNNGVKGGEKNAVVTKELYVTI